MINLDEYTFNEIIENENNVSYLNKLFLNYLKENGFDNSSKSLEKEMKIEEEFLFDETFKEKFFNLEFLNCIEHYKDKTLKKEILIEILKLSFILEIKNNKKEEFFFDLKKKFINYKFNHTDIKDITDLLFYDYEYIRKNIIDIDDRTQLNNKYLKIENMLLDKNYNVELDRILINNHKFIINNCKFHNDIYKNENLYEINIENNHCCNLKNYPYKNIKEYEFIKSEINIVKLSTDLNYIAIGYMNCSLIVLKLQDNEDNLNYLILHNKIKFHKKEINDINFNKTNDYLLTCSNDFSFIVFEINSGNVVLNLEKAHNNYITGAIFINFYNDIITCGVDGYIKLWSIEGSLKKEIKLKRIKQMVISNDELNLYLLTGNSKYILIIDILNYCIVNKIYSDESIISIEVSEDSKFLILNCSIVNPVLKLYDLNTLKIIKNYRGFKQEKFIMKSRFDMENNLIFCTSENGNIYIWHMNLSEPIFIISNKNCLPINDIDIKSCYNKSYSRVLVSGGDNYKLNIYTD